MFIIMNQIIGLSYLKIQIGVIWLFFKFKKEEMVIPFSFCLELLRGNSIAAMKECYWKGKRVKRVVFSGSQIFVNWI